MNKLVKTKASIIILSYFVSLLTLTSCNPCVKGSGHTKSETRILSNFTEVRSNGSYNIVLIEGNESKVTIHGDENILSHVKTNVNNGILEIETKGVRCIRHSEDIIIYVTTPVYSEIKLNGSGKISSQDTLHCENLTVKLSGSGEFSLKVVSQNLTVKLSGSGTYNLFGNTKALSVVISGSGDVNAFQLRSNTSNVSISGSGNCEVNSVDYLTISISGSGNVKYANQPIVNKTISGSGSVSHI